MFTDMGYIPTMVCTAHMRFVPCRKGSPESPCVTTSEPDKVLAVGTYQREGEDHG